MEAFWKRERIRVWSEERDGREVWYASPLDDEMVVIAGRTPLEAQARLIGLYAAPILVSRGRLLEAR